MASLHLTDKDSFRRSYVLAQLMNYMHNGPIQDLQWLARFDHRIIAEGKSTEYILDLAAVDKHERSVVIAVEVAANTRNQDGSRKPSLYECSRVPIYLRIDCKHAECTLFRSNGLSYEEVDMNTMFPGLPDFVRKAVDYVNQRYG